MRYILIIITTILSLTQVYSQDSVVGKLTKFRFDLQAFGNSPIFSAGVSKSFLVGKKSLIEARIGAGFYFEFKENKYPDDSGYWIVKTEPEPTYGVPIELTFTPDYNKNFSFSIGAAYTYFSGLSIYADPVTFQLKNYRAPVERFFFTLGSDYIIKRRLYLGLRLMSIYEFDRGFATPFVAPFPSIRYKF
jgi:hypothetical protein